VLAFGHLSVLVSIVVGLSVSQVLFGVGQLLRRRGSYKIDAQYLLCNAIVLVVLVDSWWAVYSWRDASSWSYRMTWFVLLNPLLVTMAAQLLPPDWEEKPLDIHAMYYKNHRLIFGLLAFYPLVDLLDARLKGAEHFRSLGPGYPITSAGMAALCGIAALAKGRRVQIACSVGILLIASAWIFEIYTFVPM
jgi:hypothetical protein